jgi:CBS domain-containing protein
METMIKNKIRRIPVIHPGTRKLEGMVRTREIVDFLGGGPRHDIVLHKFGGNFYAAINEPVRTIMLRQFPAGHIYMSISEAARFLLETGVGGVPIVNREGNIEGIVSERDFVAYVPPTTGTPVSYYMTRRVVTAGPKLTVREAARRMISWGVRRLPVVEGGQLVGVVTTVDLIRYFGTSHVFRYMQSNRMDEVLSVPVEELMTKRVLTVDPSTDVGEAAGLMRERGCGGLPVVERSSLVGIITEHDVLRAII